MKLKSIFVATQHGVLVSVMAYAPIIICADQLQAVMHFLSPCHAGVTMLHLDLCIPHDS